MQKVKKVANASESMLLPAIVPDRMKRLPRAAPESVPLYAMRLRKHDRPKGLL